MTRIIAVAACDHALLADPLPLLRQCAALGVWAVELRLDYLPDAWLPVELRERAGLGAEDRWPEHRSRFEEFAADGEDSGSAGSLGRIGFRGDSAEQSAPTYSIAKWLRHHIRRAWKDDLAVRHGLPRLVATARRAHDTGHFPDEPNRARFALLKQCFEAGCDIVDIEIDVAQQPPSPELYELYLAIEASVEGPRHPSLRLPGRESLFRAIGSLHFDTFNEEVLNASSRPELPLIQPNDVAEATPDYDLKPRFGWVSTRHANLGKLAMPILESVEGNERLANSWWSLTAPRRYNSFQAVAPLGPLGAGLRWYAENFGWGYAYFAAPGQHRPWLSLPAMDRVRRIGRFKLEFAEGSRRLVTYSDYTFGAVAGGAALSSLSPLIHGALSSLPNGGFRYAPLQTNDLKTAAYLAEGTPGHETRLSITNPLKEQALSWDYFAPDEIAKAVGAANTASKSSYMGTEHYPWRATNTDVGGFLAALATRRSDEHVAKSRVLVYGYGGSARAVLYALRGKAGAVFVAGRNADKGKVVAANFGAAWHPAPETDDFGFDIVINTTPCGQPGGPAAQQSPCDLSRLELNPKALVFDLVYGVDTPLAQQARALGIEYEDGLNMLLEQAYLQQQFWGLRHERPNQTTHQLLRGACRRASRGMPWTPPLRIALIGYRGAGKSTVGALLAKQLDIPHVDLDREVARVAGFGDDPGLAFTTLGEAAFREFEGQVLRELSTVPEHEYRHGNTPLVVSCGGGVVEGTSSLINLYEGFTVIDLQAKPETLLARMAADHNSNRPALEPGRTPAEELAIRSARRDPWHRAIADHAIDTTTLTPVQVAEAAHTWLLGIDRDPATRA